MRTFVDILLSPKSQQDLRLRNALVATVFIAAFLLLYVIPFTLTADLKTNGAMALLFLIVVVVVDILVSSVDPLQYSKSKVNRHASFFQSQFPSLYISNKYSLSPAEARQKWFSVFNQWASPEHPNHAFYLRAFARGYECRAVYYLQWLSIRVLALSVLALVLFGALSALGFVSPGHYYAFPSSSLAVPRVLFPVFLLCIYAYVSRSNKIDEKGPTGVWLKWNEINDILKAWWDQHESA